MVMGSVRALEQAEIRFGQAKGRYFRENVAQGGVDLVQIIPELVTNADAAIAASGRASSRILLLRAPRPVPCPVAGGDASPGLAGAGVVAA